MMHTFVTITTNRQISSLVRYNLKLLTITVNINGIFISLLKYARANRYEHPYFYHSSVKSGRFYGVEYNTEP